MKSISKVISSIMLLTIILSSVTFAGNNEDQEILNELQAIGDDYGLTMVELDDDYQGQILKFDSIDEFKIFMQEQEKKAKENGFDIKEKTIEINLPVEMEKRELSISNYSTSIIYSASYHWSQWSPYTNPWVTGLFATKNIYFDYDYINEYGIKRFQSVYNITSVLSGASWGGWQHVKGNIPSYSLDRTTANISVEGYYFLGVHIGDVPLGYVDTDTWSVSLKLN